MQRSILRGGIAASRKVGSLGLLPHPVPSIAGTQRYIASEIEKWGRLVKRLGLAGKI